MTREMQIVNSHAELDENLLSQIHETMFTPPNIKDLKMDRCLRILPHQQDTGGFFVAVFKKLVDTLAWESIKLENEETEKNECNEELDPSWKPVPRKFRKQFRNQKSPGRRVYNEDPFLFIKEDEPIWKAIKEYYKIGPEFPFQQLMYRNAAKEGKKRNLYFVTKTANTLIEYNADNIKVRYFV